MPSVSNIARDNDEKIITVVGNGKSLKDFDFELLKNKEWVGCCLGFRHWEITGIYPTHYVCVDNVICKHHRYKILDMIKNKKCKSFVLCASIYHTDIKDELMKYESVYTIQELVLSDENPFRYLVDFCSGTTSVLYAYILSSTKINLLGMDCKYVEFLPECIENEDGSLTITEKIKDNPNYYFNEYQQVGDIYNKPNVEKVHKKSWWDLRNTIMLFNILRQAKIEVFNYNLENNTELDEYFVKLDINDYELDPLNGQCNKN